MALSAYRRVTDFMGLTDKYLDAALFGSSILDVSRMQSDEWQEMAVQRLDRYRENWMFYKGDQFVQYMADGERKSVLNYCRKVADKSTDWLFATPFEVVSPPGNEAASLMVESVFRANRMALQAYYGGQMGAVTGDCFFQVTLNTHEIDAYSGERIQIPFDQWQIRIRRLDSSHVFPVFSSDDPHRMEACLIQYPISASAPIVSRIDPRAAEAKSRRALYSIFITPTEVREFINHEETDWSPFPNLLGEIGVVHIQNLALAKSSFGFSDLDGIKELCEDLNTVVSNIRQIIDNHANPITILYGARVGQLVRGPNKLWGLPEKARVEILKLEGELTAAVAFTDMLKDEISVHSDTPRSALQTPPSVGNTTKAAIDMVFLPLTEKTLRKHLTYGDGLARLGGIVLRALERIFLLDLRSYVAYPQRRYDLKIKFGSPIPENEIEKLEVTRQKLELGLESKYSSLVNLGVEDVRKKIVEILADEREKLVVDAERGKAAQGMIPNLRALSLGSLAIGGDLVEIFEADDEIFEQTAQIAKDLQDSLTQLQVAQQQEQMMAEQAEMEEMEGMVEDSST